MNPKHIFDMDSLLKEIIKPEHVGCRHLKAMIEDSESLQVKATIVSTVIQSFFSIYFNPQHPLRKMMMLHVFENKFSPSNQVIIKFNGKCKA